MRHKMLNQRTLFVVEKMRVVAKKVYAESAFRDACRTSSVYAELCTMTRNLFIQSKRS